MANKIQGITVKIGGDTIDLQKVLKEVNKKSVNLNSELTQINRQLHFDPSSAVLLSQKQKVLTETIETSRDKLKQLEAVQQDIERQYKNGEIDDGQYRAYQREVEQTKSKLKDYEGQLKKASITQQDFDKKVEDARATLEKNKQSLKSGAKQFLKWGAAAGAALGGAAGAAVKYASEFETAFAKTSTLLSDGVDLQAYKDDIIATSNEIGVAANDVAEATYSALSASVPEDKAVEFVKNAYKLKKAGFTELETSVDILTTSMNAYGIAADKTNHISDVLITTQNLGKTTIAELGSKMGKVIPTAAAYKVQLEELGTEYALLTKKGVNTANSTTQIKALLNELNKAGSTADKALNAVSGGKTFADLKKEGKNVIEILDLMQKSVDGNTTAFGNMFGNTNAKAAALSLMATGVEEYNAVLKQMTNSEGTAEKAYKKMADTAEHKLEVIKTNIENSAITIGNGLLPAVSDVLEEVEKHLPEIQKMAEELGDKLSDDIKWVIKNGDTILKTIKFIGIEAGGIFAVVKSYNAVKTIISTVQALKTLKTATDAAKVAQLGLNAAEKANVIAAVVSGLIILGTTLWNVADSMGLFEKKHYYLTDAEEKLIEKINEETKALKEAREARQKASAEVESEYGHYQQLYEELDKIVDKNGKVKEGEEDRARFITDTLSDALGVEFEWNGKILQNYKDQKKAIKDLIEVKKNEALLSVHEEDYKNALKTQDEKLSDYQKAENVYQSAKSKRKDKKKRAEKLNKALNSYNKKVAAGTNTSSDDDEAWLKQNELHEINQFLRDSKSEYNDIKKDYLNAYANYTETTSLISNYEKASEALISKDKKTMNKAFSDLKANFVTTGKTTAKEMKTILDQQVDDMEKSYENTKKSFDKGEKGITEQSVKNAERLKNRSLNQIIKFRKNTFQTAGDSIKEEHGKILSQQKNEIVSAFEKIKTAYNNGEKGITKQQLLNAKELRDQAVAEWEKFEENVSAKSKKTADKVVDSGTKVDTEENKEKGKQRTKNLIEGILTDDLVNWSQNKYKKLGKDAGEGFRLGILSKSADTAKAAFDFVKNTIKAVKKAQNSNSPSKETYALGGDFVDGYANAIGDKTKKARENARAMARQSLAQINAVQAKAKTSLGGESLAARVSSQIEPARQTLIKNTKKTTKNATSINVTFGEVVNIHNEQDINTLADRVSERIAAEIEREGSSFGE